MCVFSCEMGIIRRLPTTNQKTKNQTTLIELEHEKHWHVISPRPHHPRVDVHGGRKKQKNEEKKKNHTKQNPRGLLTVARSQR